MNWTKTLRKIITSGDKMLKKVVIILCIAALLSLVACKQNMTLEEIGSATAGSGDNEFQDSTTSGILLEEDVFDDSNITSVPSSSNAVESSKNQNTSGNSSANTNASGNTSTEQSSDSEGFTESKNEIVVEQDGTITLPVDWF